MKINKQLVLPVLVMVAGFGSSSVPNEEAGEGAGASDVHRAERQNHRQQPGAHEVRVFRHHHFRRCRPVTSKRRGPA